MIIQFKQQQQKNLIKQDTRILRCLVYKLYILTLVY